MAPRLLGFASPQCFERFPQFLLGLGTKSANPCGGRRVLPFPRRLHLHADLQFSRALGLGINTFLDPFEFPGNNLDRVFCWMLGVKPLVAFFRPSPSSKM